MYFRVYHDPAAQPRPRFTKRGRVYSSNGKCKSYRNEVKQAAKAELGGRKPAKGPVSVCLTFYMPRPKRLTWKKKAMRLLWHTSTPDIDNLVKSTLDAINGIAFEDDSQVCVLTAKKYISGSDESPGVHVVIRSLNEAHM